MVEIQRADPITRRRAVSLVVLGVLIGATIVFAFERYRPVIERCLRSDPDQLTQRLATVTTLSVLVTAVPLFAFAVHLWIRGKRVRRDQRFPLQSERLVRDTPVIRGKAAARRGVVLQCLAIALAVLATGLAVVLWRLAILIGNH